MRFGLTISMILVTLFVQAQAWIIPADQEPYSPESLVADRFIGDGVEVLNISHEGTQNSVGYFTDYASLIGIDEGIILSTGLALNANFNNSGNESGTTSNLALSDDDIQNIVGGSNVVDISRYTIEFIPLSDSLSFNYVFASEEYNEFVCSNFNDIFGFFLTGPNPDGGEYDSKNIALVPDPADPKGDTFLDIPVRINTVNNGTQGSNNTTDQINCEEPNGSFAFSQYFNENPIGNKPTFDGYLDIFKAKARVVPCQTYTMKIVIADVVDRDFDSAVFLEAKSFSSGFLEIETESQSVDGTLAEGCSEGSLKIELPEIKDEDFILNLNLLDPDDFFDAAELDLDFTDFPSQIIIPAGQSFVIFPLTILDDDIDEGIEHIYFDIRLNDCVRDTLKVSISDDLLSQIVLPEDTTICPGESFLIQPVYPVDFFIPQPSIFSNSTDIQIVETDLKYNSVIEVENVNPFLLNDRFFRSICIDTFIARDLTDFDFFLRGPDEQLLELSTDNGFKVNNDLDIDTLINTCFSISPVLNINNGNAVLGPAYGSNPTYSGNYFPEGPWSDFFFSNDAVTNGIWELVVVSDTQQSAQDISDGLPVLKNWSVQFFADYSVDFDWYKDGVLQSCSDCRSRLVTPEGPEEYVFITRDSRGCSSSDTFLIDVFEEVLPPTNLNCANEEFSQILITWDASPNANCYEVKLRPEDPWTVLGDVTSYLAENLDYATNYTFFVRAKDDRCVSDILSIECMTEDCPQPTADVISSLESSCFQVADAELVIEASGGSGGPYTYTIQGQTNMTGIFQGLLGGADAVFIRDGIGCPVNIPVVIPEPDELEMVFDVTHISCSDFNDGEVMVTPSGLFEPITIEWENGSMDFFRDQLAPGWYYLTATDANACEKTDSVFIENPPLHELLNVELENISCFGASDGSIGIIHQGGTLPYVYDWSHNWDGRVASNLGPGMYSVTVYDANTCSFVIEREIIEPELLELESSFVDAACYLSTSGQASVTVSGGTEPYEFLWDTGWNGDTLFNASTGAHDVLVVDANDCSVTADFFIDSPPALTLELTQEPASCFGFEDGSVSLQTDLGNTILWNTGDTTADVINLGFGEYCVTVTDDNMCTSSDCISIEQATELQVGTVADEASCFNGSDGSIFSQGIGGTGAYQYSWTGPNGFLSDENLIENLEIGMYQLTITDDNNCTSSVELELTAESNIEFEFVPVNINCAGGNTGELSVMPLGAVYPVQYIWEGPNNFNSNDSLNMGLFAGEYFVTVTDANNCESISSFSLTENDRVDIILNEIVNIECGGTPTGSILIDAIGGTPPYSFLWDNGINDQNLQNAFAGSYTVIVTDQFNCQNSETFIIEENATVGVDLIVENVACEGEANGSISAQGTGGEGEYLYSLNGEAPSPNGNFVGLGTGSYNLFVEDLGGCTAYVDSILIVEEYALGVDLGDPLIVEYNGSFNLSPIITGNTDGLTYNWNSFEANLLSCYNCPNPSVSNFVESTEIGLTVSNVHGCTDKDELPVSIVRSIIVKVPTAFSPNGDGTNDELLVFGNDKTTINLLKIYSRWGELVFQRENFQTNEQQGWDGRFNGRVLDPGVFHYVIEASYEDGTIEIFKGNTTLIR